MHLNLKSSGLLSAVLSIGCSLLAGVSAHAASLSDIAVAEGYGYTNVTVSATLGDVTDTVTLVYSVKKQDGTTLTSYEVAGCSAGPVSRVINLGSLYGFVKGKTYVYEVAVKGADAKVATTYFNVGWLADDYFKADATSGSSVTANGAWETPAPGISDGTYQFAGTQHVFAVTSVRQDADHKILDAQFTIDYDSYCFLDDITNDVSGAIVGLALVTNDANAASASWMVLTNGTVWTATDASTDAMKALGTYQARVELDYNESPALVRYSIRKQTDDAWTVLSLDGKGWTAATNDTPNVSAINFSGQAKLAKFNAKLSTKNLAQVDASEYSDVVSAMAAAKTSGKTLLLFTNVRVDPSKLVAGDYAFNANGKSFTLTDHEWKVSDKSQKTVVVDGGILRVIEDVFVAKIGADDATAAVYTNLTMALAAGQDRTVVLLTDVAANATSTVANAALDLAGFALTEKASDLPVLTVDGESASLYLTGAGSITGATYAAICATNGATVAIDGIFVTNNTGYAIFATDAALVEVSNGWFQANGAIKADLEFALQANQPSVKLRGGYFVDGTTFEGISLLDLDTVGVRAFGGKFTDASATSEVQQGHLKASGHKFVNFALPVATNGVTLAYEVMTNVYNGSTNMDTKVWSVTDDQGGTSIGGVQLPDLFMDQVKPGWTGTTEEARKAAQDELSKESAYTGIKKWQCYVLGMPEAATNGAPTTTVGPRAEAAGAQDTSTTSIGFKMATPSAVKAAESGCKVEYEVEEYTSAECSGTPEKTSGRKNYDETAEIANPSGVRYYKMKVYVTPKK